MTTFRLKDRTKSFSCVFDLKAIHTVIPPWIYRIPPELRSQARLGFVSIMKIFLRTQSTVWPPTKCFGFQYRTRPFLILRCLVGPFCVSKLYRLEAYYRACALSWRGTKDICLISRHQYMSPYTCFAPSSCRNSCWRQPPNNNYSCSSITWAS